MAVKQSRVLVLHHDIADAAALKRALEAHNVTSVHMHLDAATAGAAIAELRPDLIIAHAHPAEGPAAMPGAGQNGAAPAGLLVIDTQAWAMDEDPQSADWTRVLVTDLAPTTERTGFEAADLLERLRLRASAKPMRPCAVSGSQLRLLGSSSAVVAVQQRIDRFACRDITVLITGESGTGKELVAKLIHQRSDRRTEPFVPINCTALPESLLESVLFGHRAGAFTDAKEDQIGLLASADRGTILLDEIGDSSPSFQAKLLRFLQEGTFRPVGSITEEHSRVRVIAASHREIDDRVREGRFRNDLFQRLRVATIHVPPLRERRADILALSDHFLQQIAETEGGEAFILSPSASERLLAHDWPGNVRELEHTLLRATLLADLGVIMPRDLELCEAGQIGSAVPFLPLDELVRQHAQAAVDLAGGNKSKAARMLGISRARLRRTLGDGATRL